MQEGIYYTYTSAYTRLGILGTYEDQKKDWGWREKEGKIIKWKKSLSFIKNDDISGTGNYD